MTFNQQTAISYQLVAGCRVKVAVFDVLGREVAVLVDKLQPASHQRIIWDAFDVASGVYLIRMKAGDFVAVKKMRLVK